MNLYMRLNIIQKDAHFDGKHALMQRQRLMLCVCTAVFWVHYYSWCLQDINAKFWLKNNIFDMNNRKNI